MPAHTPVTPVPAPATYFDLVSHWRLQAPVEQVWAALADPAGWPGWWPCVRQVQTLREGRPDGLGAMRRLTWSTRLPYRIVIDVEAVEARRLERLRGRSCGHLEGEGLWLLRADGRFTDVTYVWRVRLVRRWMRWLAPLLAPLFRWNHAEVMRAGEVGLQRYLRSLEEWT